MNVKNKKGFTLIELIVCICIGFIMMLIAGQFLFGMYQYNKKNLSNDNPVVIIQQQDEEQTESRY